MTRPARGFTPAEIERVLAAARAQKAARVTLRRGDDVLTIHVTEQSARADADRDVIDSLFQAEPNDA